MAVMLTILDKRWLSMGWRPQNPDDAEPMAMEFISEFDRHEIPYRYWLELYHRSSDLRMKRLGQGLKCEDFSKDLMIACWPALRAEIQQRRIDEGRTLTANAESICILCDGSGFEKIFKDGKQVGVKPGCKHERIDDSKPVDGIAALEEAIRDIAKMQTATPVEIVKKCLLAAELETWTVEDRSKQIQANRGLAWLRRIVARVEAKAEK